MKKLLLGLLIGLLAVPATLNILAFQAERNGKICVETAMKEFQKALEEGENPFEALEKQQVCLEKAYKPARKAFDILLAPSRTLNNNGEKK